MRNFITISEEGGLVVIRIDPTQRERHVDMDELRRVLRQEITYRHDTTR